jgi:hypothetical protein
MKKIAITGIIIGSILVLILTAWIIWPGKMTFATTGKVVDTTSPVTIVPTADIPSEAPQKNFIEITEVSPKEFSETQNIFTNIVVTFNEAMDPITVNGNTFYIRGPNNKIITGIITSDSTKKIWTFNPTDNFESNTLYYATITNGAKGISGNSLITDFFWSFTTGYNTISGGSSGESTTTTPTTTLSLTKITLTPITATIIVGDIQQLTATGLDQNDDPIAATITYNSSNETVATVNSTGYVTSLAVGTTTITAASGTITNTTEITVIGLAGPARVDLGTAENFAIISKAAISNVPTSDITGDVGISPAAGTFITGLDCPEVTGSVYGPVGEGGGSTAACINVSTAYMDTVIGDMETAFTNATARALDVTMGASIAGLTLTPGVYFTASSLGIETDVTLDCQGNENGTFIFQIGGALTMDASTNIILAGSCNANNIFWAVSGTTDIGGGVGTESTFEGTVIGGPATTEITVVTGSTIHGRLLSEKTIALDANTVTVPL